MSKPTSVRLSTEAINSYGTWLPTAGAKLEKFKANPVMFYNHKTYSMLPIGTWANIRIENNQLLADPVFDDDENSQAIKAKWESGSIRGASIGADIVTMSSDPVLIKPGQTRPTISEYEIYEASLTPLPANAECLTLNLRHNGILLSEGSVNNLPLLKSETNMKPIALALGLPEGATEAQVLEKIAVLSALAGKAEKLEAHLSKQADGLNEQQKPIFMSLSKTDPDQALAYLELCKTNTPPSQPSKGEKVSQLIKQGKQELNKGDEQEETFDSLQKNNPAKLAELRRSDPAKYQELADNHLALARAGKLN